MKAMQLPARVNDECVGCVELSIFLGSAAALSFDLPFTKSITNTHTHVHTDACTVILAGWWLVC